MVRCASGRDGRRAADAEEAPAGEPAAAAGSVSSCGGNVGDMMQFERYVVTEFLLTTVNIDTKLDLIQRFVNRTGAKCYLEAKYAGRAGSLPRAEEEWL